MNLLDLFVKISVDDKASGQMDSLSAGILAKGQLMASAVQTAVSAAMNGIKQLVSGAVNAYSQYEQLAGGIETFFGSASSTVISNAQNAYKTAGMSANQYMQTVSSFATTLVNSVAQRGHEVAETSAADAQRISEEYSRALADQIDELKYQQQDYLDARREAQQQEIQDTQRAQQEETEAFQRATDERIKQINREYLEKIKLVDKEEYDRLKAIQDQIDQINEQGKKEKEANEKRERESKMSALREKEATATSYKDIMDARRQMSELRRKYDEEDAENERRDRLENLNKQKQDVKDSANERRNVLREQQQQEVSDYKEGRDQELKALRESHQQQLDEIRRAHSEELKELQRAQAEQLKAAQRHNEDLLAAKKQMLAEAQDGGKEFVKATEQDQEEAARLAQKAIVDMADNANKMGTSMEMIQNAYQGFAKDNFTMLDNLKLGYGGTRTEMERLLNDAESISAAHGEMRDFSIDSFADIVEAIHVVQQEYEVSGYSVEELTQKLQEHSLTEQEVKRVAQDLGISYEEAMQRMQSGTLTAQDAIVLTGTTSYEAASTVEGSVNRMQAAWENWITSLANPDMDLTETTDNLVDSVITAAENVIPRVGDVLTRLGETIAAHVPDITEKLGSAFYDAVPPEFQQTLDDLGERLQKVGEHWQPVIDSMRELADKVAPKVGEVLKYIYDNALTQALLPALGVLGDSIAHLTSAMGDWVDPLMNVIGILGNAFVGVLGIVISTIATAIDIVAAIMEALRKFGDFLNDVGAAIGRFVDDAGKFFEDFGKGVDETIKSVIDWFTHLPENILSALGDLGKLLWNAGQDIINGLWDGLKDAFGHVQDWVEGIGKWIQDHKGPKRYDLNLLIPNGKWIMQGLERGMRESFPMIEGVVSDIEGMMSIGSPNLSIGTATANALPSVNVYMTYNAGEDAQELVYDMVGQLRRYGYTMGGRV
jgi:phage-related protein